ncbi:MAG TPA: hypothetical protein VED59_07780 [Acidimicrobiales bacterium]|nr:hypothetical protein [Acidimicrobiales bacterium]
MVRAPAVMVTLACLAFLPTSGLLGGTTASPTVQEALRPATDQQVRAFLAEAQARLAGSFTSSYSAVFGGRGKRVTVYGAQLSQTVTMYREMPPMGSFATPGAKAPVSYEVFEVGPDGRRFAGVGDGSYSCTLGAPGGRWACQGPYKGIGMGTTFELTAPYPPPELARGLSNAAYYYLGLGGMGPRASEKAYFFSEGAPGHKVSCLGFGSRQHLVGSACLGPHGLVSYYSLPTTATGDTYVSAKMLSFSPKVPLSVFRLPSPPSLAHL